MISIYIPESYTENTTLGLSGFFNFIASIISENFESRLNLIKSHIQTVYEEKDTLVLYLAPQFARIIDRVLAGGFAMVPVIDFLNPHPHWKFLMNDCDILFSFSAFVSAGCDQLGCKTTRIDAPLFPSRHNLLRNIPKYEKFTFLSLENPHWRKGTDDLIKAFKKVFSGNKDVQLILKFSGPFIQEQEEILKLIDIPNIIPVKDGYFGLIDISEFYLRSHCYVSNTRAEMLGLTMFEAVEAHLPVIAPAGTPEIYLPFREYMGEQPSILYTEGEYRRIGEIAMHPELENSVAFFADTTILEDCLYDMYHNYSKYSADTESAFNTLMKYDVRNFLKKFSSVAGGMNEDFVHWREPLYAHSDGHGACNERTGYGMEKVGA